MNYADYPAFVVEDIARVRRRLASSGLPPKTGDANLLIATWNIRAFGPVYEQWTENPGSPKRNLRGLAILAEIIRRMDVVAVQEVRSNTSGIRLLVDEFLGPDWGLMLSDISAGERGNTERLGFLYDRRRVQPSGLAGEIVLPPSAEGDPQEQFDRTPYIVGFRSGSERFALLTAHIRYGAVPLERLPELLALAEYTAREIRDRATDPGAEERNLIVLGDFNIDRRDDNPLFNAFISTGLNVPQTLVGIRSSLGTEARYYDQIGWFMDESFNLKFNDKAGCVDFSGAVFKDLNSFLMSFRVSDHFPLWVEFGIDRSVEQMGRALGLSEAELGAPDPFAGIPD